MSRMSFRGGLLVYTGDIGQQQPGRIEGTVRGFMLDARRDFAMTGPSFPQQAVPLLPEYSARFELETFTISTAVPPEEKALRELARRHPEEYAEILEGESVIRALGG